MRMWMWPLSLIGLLAWASPASADQSCAEVVCVSAGEWRDGETLDRKARQKEAKANRKRGEVEVVVVVADQRGSIFIDGRWQAHGRPRALAPGKHEVELREQGEVLALGVLVVPRGADSIEVSVTPGA